jgi:hypothetical protein
MKSLGTGILTSIIHATGPGDFAAIQKIEHRQRKMEYFPTAGQASSGAQGTLLWLNDPTAAEPMSDEVSL